MRALICGISGQDGAYLAEFLTGKGYEVIGTSRDADTNSFANLKRLGLDKKVRTASMAVTDFSSVLQALRHHKPDEIYNLAGQTSVALSFQQPLQAMESISGGTLNILEAIRFAGLPARLYSAGSGECFGDTGADAASEQTELRPRSPYGVAKASAYWLVRNYRQAYGQFACTGILFNHESELRPERFVTQKIVQAAARISRGSREVLQLGNTRITRDWGWAPDYVRAMWLMLQRASAEDFVIATGRSESLEYFASRAFDHFGLAWEQHTEIVEGFFRPSDIAMSRADPTRARTELGWRHSCDVDKVVSMMCEAAQSQAGS